ARGGWTSRSRNTRTSAVESRAPPPDAVPPLAHEHAAPATTLALAKATSLGCGRAQPLAWCSRPRNWAASAEAALVVASDQAAERLAEDAERGRDERAEVERHRAVGDPFEIVRELLGHRGLVAATNLGEAGQPRADDEPLPVRGQLVRKLLKEARADRPRADQAHVPAKHVPELRQLVELRGAEAPAEPCGLLAGAEHELLAEVWPEPLLGSAAQGGELEHVEDPTVAADAIAAVEQRSPARQQKSERDQPDQRREDEQEKPRDEHVEGAELQVDPALRRPSHHGGETLDERVAGPRLRS